MGQVLAGVGADADGEGRDEKLQAGPQATKAGRRAKAGGRRKRREPGKGKLGLSLKGYHQRLADEGYVPPAAPSNPLVYAGRKPKKRGNRVLTDAEVIEARALVKKESVKTLAEKYGVSYRIMYAAIRGLTYKHLNMNYAPQW